MPPNDGAFVDEGEIWSERAGQEMFAAPLPLESFYRKAGLCDISATATPHYFADNSTAIKTLNSHLDCLGTLPAVLDGPGISIVLPNYNRAHVITQAIKLVQAQSYGNWELIIVDDGSNDETASTIASFLTDERIRYIARPRMGVAAARNHGLRNARHSIVAYLDSDNRFTPYYLREVARAFQMNPTAQWLYAAQWVQGQKDKRPFIRFRLFDSKALKRANFIDMNAMAHRRKTIAATGPFDPAFNRLVDWDFAQRLANIAPPLALPIIGSLYTADSHDSISRREDLGRNQFLFRRKHRARLSRPLKVLYAVWHYPQLSESYVRWEIECLQKWGVEVTLWRSSDEPTPAPFQVNHPLLHGDLGEVIKQVQPDVVHSHWLSFAWSIAGQVRAAKLPLTVRDHAFDTSRRLVHWAQIERSVKGVYLFPTLRKKF